MIIPNGGISFGRDPLVCRFLKGIFELKPCLPKYSEIWDVNNVLCYFKSCGLVDQMDLKDLTMNLATLLCLLDNGGQLDNVAKRYIRWISTSFNWKNIGAL